MSKTSDHGRNDGYALDRYGALIDEALALLGEGVPAATIELASRSLGLGEGALELLDRLSLAAADEVVHSSHDHDHDHDHGHGHDHDHGHGHGDKATTARALTKEAVYVVEKMSHGFRRTGRDSGGGFYDYVDGEPPTLWSGLRQFERRGVDLPGSDIADRLLYAQLIASERVGGLRSGPASLESADALIARIGRARFVARSSELAAAYGDRFLLPQSLRDRSQGHSDTAA